VSIVEIIPLRHSSAVLSIDVPVRDVDWV